MFDVSLIGDFIDEKLLVGYADSNISFPWRFNLDPDDRPAANLGETMRSIHERL